MKRLRTLFYGMTHEHACGKLETLKALKDEFEVVAIVDDRPRKTIAYADHPIDPTGIRIVSEAEAFDIPDIDVGFVETTNHDLIDVAAKFVFRGIPLHCDKPCGETMEPYRSLVETCRAKDGAFPCVQFDWA